MSFERRIVFGGLAVWVSRGATVVLGLVLLPVLFRNLSKEQMGAWLLLGQGWVALGLFDLGFGVILTRYLAFALSKDRGGLKLESGSAEVGDLLRIGRRLYTGLALTSVLISLGSAMLVFGKLKPHQLDMAELGCVWTALCLAQGVSIWSTPYNCLLQAKGYVGCDNLLASAMNALVLTLQILSVAMGGSLVSLAVLAASGAIAQRWLIIRFIRPRCLELLAHPGRPNQALFRKMLRPALKGWLTSVGYLLLVTSDSFFIAANNGPAAIPAYRSAFLLVINLHMLAGVFSAASPIFVSKLWQAGDLTRIRSILRRNAQIGLFSLASAAGVLMSVGATLFELWLGRGNFVGYAVLATFLITFFLEHHANAFSTCGRATNDEAYAGWSIAAGVLKLGLAFFLTKSLGLLGLAVSTLIAQGLTNDWFMVYRSAKLLGVNLAQHARHVLVPAAVMFCVVFLLSSFAAAILHQQHPIIRVAAISFGAAAVLLSSIWFLVLAPADRKALTRGAYLPSSWREIWIMRA
jgi:O-antigen/teichoic acid export membrane protein